jgi:hypothetical protein
MRHLERTASRLAGLMGSLVVLVVVITAWARQPAAPPAGGAGATPPGDVLRGRIAVIRLDCAGCHGGFPNPSNPGWLAGVMDPQQEFKIGPCYVTPGAKPCFITRPRNLTPDNATGLGRFSARQIYNALKFGLRPEDTPDVVITSTTPGQGNFPEHPHYLAPPMPWTTWRYLPEQELWDIIAYLQHGLKPVVNKVPDSEGPPDFWASEYAKPMYGGAAVPAFPTANERKP